MVQVALGVAQAGLSLAGGFFGSKAAKKAARRKAAYIRKMAKYNADVKYMEAKSIANTMRFESKVGAKSIYKMQASQRAAASKDLAKVPLEVLVDQASEMSTQLNAQRRNRLLQEQNTKQQAKAITFKGEMQATSAIAEGKAQARAAMIKGITGSASSLLGSFSGGGGGGGGGYASPSSVSSMMNATDPTFGATNLSQLGIR